jgi:hypothetical protein
VTPMTRIPYPPPPPPSYPPSGGHAPHSALPLLPSPPRRSFQQQQQQQYPHPPPRSSTRTTTVPAAAAAIVTPQASPYEFYHHQQYQQQQQRHPQQHYAVSTLSSPTRALRHAATPDDRDLLTPVFPVDVFQNADYTTFHDGQQHQHRRQQPFLHPTTTSKTSSGGSGIQSHHERPDTSPGGGFVSPTREQKPKRQRMLKDSNDDGTLNSSMNTDESFVELDTSGESSGGGTRNINNSFCTTASAAAAGALTEAIETQLTLEDRVIRSPSELLQSFAGGGRRRISPHPSSSLMLMPTPPRHTFQSSSRSTTNLDMSADSMDGLAALSTAAFLRLDESC